MSQPISRRNLLQATAAAGLSAAAYRRAYGANERIGVGYIGFGLIGKRHVLDFQAQSDVQGVAVCDAHRGRLEEAKSLIGGGVRGYSDFRKLLDDKDVQAVVVSTPDHWHSLLTMLACAAGKDVYVEKPLTLFVREGQWVIDVAARNKSVVQVGTQQRSGPHYGRARQLVREGAIGRVHSVRMQSYRNIMPGFGAPPDGNPPPELDWNTILGPAPLRPYNPNRGLYHFRWFWDYSGGQMTNLGQHSLDIVHWTLGSSLVAVSSMGGRFALQDNGETPDTQDALFEFVTDPADGSSEKRQWTAIWSHREASAGTGGTMGIEFYGTKGMLAIDRRGFKITADKKIPPENRVPQFGGPSPVGAPQPVAVSGGDQFWCEAVEDRTGSQSEQFVLHVRNFLDCVKSRATPIADPASAHRVSTMCHLANLSLRLGRKLRWDARRQQVLDDPQATAALVRPYRAPWDAELKALQVG